MSSRAIVFVVLLACDPRQLGITFAPQEAGAATAATTDEPPPPPPPPPTGEPRAPAPAPAPPPAAPSCAGYCDHALRCANALTPTELSSCISSCESQRPSAARLAEMTSMKCDQLLAMLGGGGRAKPAPRPAPGPGACTDCSGCYWEQDMCLYTYGYVATGIKQACKRCCCPGH